MALGGVWHGASWNFVLWGAIHGLGLAAHRIWQVRTGNAKAQGAWKFVSIFVTFHFVCLAWIFFRASSVETALQILARIGSLTISAANVSRPLWMVLGIGLAAHYLPKAVYERSLSWYVRAPFYAQAVVLLALAAGIQYVAVTGAAPFIYSNF
jgi:alginate O-acetyltransferase complex protein AlgI